MAFDWLRVRGELVDEAIVVGEGGNEGGFRVRKAGHDLEGEMRGDGIEEAGNEDVSGAIVWEPIGGGGKKEAAVGLFEAVCVAKGVDDAGEIEGVWAIAAKAKTVEQPEGLVYVAMGCA